jgi:hypothetical protein
MSSTKVDLLKNQTMIMVPKSAHEINIRDEDLSHNLIMKGWMNIKIDEVDRMKEAVVKTFKRTDEITASGERSVR